MPVPITLIVAILTIESSYIEETERPAASVADTVQFCFLLDSQWRIKTFATDHDIHVHQLSKAGENRITEEFAKSNIQKSYGDVTSRVEHLSLIDPADIKEVEKVLSAHGLKGTIELAKAGFCFYNPDKGDYRTKSKPK